MIRIFYKSTKTSIPGVLLKVPVIHSEDQTEGAPLGDFGEGDLGE